MTPRPPRLRAALIGAGKRVANDALPAFRSLPDEYEVAGVFGRTARVELIGEEAVAVRALESLTSARLSELDLVYMVVSKGAVPGVLRQLAKLEPSSTDLLIETPVLLFKHLAALRELRAFRNVWVSEDVTELPWIETVERFVETGAVGRLRTAVFQQACFAYHGVALAKRVLGATRVSSGRRRALGAEFFLRDLRFDNGTSATTLEPRDYAAGRFTLVGENGSISDYTRREDTDHLLSPLVYSHTCEGFVLGGVETRLTPEESTLMGAGPSDAGVTAWTEAGKRVGFRRLLQRIHAGDGAYPLRSGLEDMAVDYHLEKLGRWRPNPLTGPESKLLHLGLRALARG